MKTRIRFFFAIALMVSMASCDRLPWFSELKEKIGGIKKSAEEIRREASGDYESYWDQGIGQEETSYDDTQYDLTGYEWLKGVWAGHDGYGNFARMIVADSYYQILDGNADIAMEDVRNMWEAVIELKTRHDDNSLDGSFFGFDKSIGVNRDYGWIYVNDIVLLKISDDITDEAIFVANHNYPPCVYSNARQGYLDIYTEPSLTSYNCGVIKNGPDGAVLLDEEDGWTKVNLQGVVGYVHSDEVQFTPTEVYVEPRSTAIAVRDEEVDAEDIEISFEKDEDELIETVTADFLDDEDVEEEVFNIVEEMPEYPGGIGMMSDFLSKNIVYPQMAREKGIQGTVFIGFIVEKDGSVSNVKVMRGIGSGCDEEAVRVVKLMPKWRPGKQRGKAVRVSYTLPLNFKLT